MFTVEVALDNVPRYNATCRQAVSAVILPQLMTGGATVAVRVDPRDHSRIALSLGEAPPTVTMASSGDPNTSSASRILELGSRCKAVIVETQPLGMRNSKGADMYAFRLTVIAEGRPPYQINVGNPVPADALPLLYPGSTVPAKRMPEGDDREVVIDWKQRSPAGNPRGLISCRTGSCEAPPGASPFHSRRSPSTSAPRRFTDNTSIKHYFTRSNNGSNCRQLARMVGRNGGLTGPVRDPATYLTSSRKPEPG